MRAALLVLVMLLTLAASGCRPQSPPPARPAQGSVKTIFVTMTESDIALSETLPGRVRALEDAPVRPEVNGIIRAVCFKASDRVAAGQVLYELGDESYQAAVDAARAALANAIAVRDLAVVKYQRNEKLLKINAVSVQECDETRFALKIAEADVLACRAKLESAEIDLDHTRIRAPVAGIAGISAVTAGALVSSRQSEALVTIRASDEVYVDMPLPVDRYASLRELRDLARSRNLQPRVDLDLGHGRRYGHPGVLILQDDVVRTTTSTLTLRALFPNPDGELISGMFVRAVISSDLTTKVMLVPMAAVAFDEEGVSYVWTITAGNEVVRQPLTLGISHGDNWQVLKGLAPGDRVVVRGLNRLREHMHVDPAPFRDGTAHHES